MSLLIVLTGTVLTLLGGTGEAKPEKYYQEKWCNQRNGKTEVRMSDGTRCDCVIPTHAIEFDFAKKWHEAIGQSLNYARHTGLRAGIVIISKGKKDANKVQSLRNTILYYQLPVDVWVIGVEP